MSKSKTAPDLSLPLFAEPPKPIPEYKYSPDISDITRLEHRRDQYLDGEYLRIRWAPAFASLMQAVRDGRPVHIRPNREPLTAAVLWEPKHTRLSFISEGQGWKPQPEDHQDMTHTITSKDSSWSNRMDHLLQAITAEWPIFIYQHDGLGIITWDRQSHSNWPMITLDEQNWLTIYYQGHPELLKHRKEASVITDHKAQAL